MVTSSRDGTVQMWEGHAAWHRRIATLYGHPDIVWSLAVMPCGAVEMVLAGGRDGIIRAYDVSDVADGSSLRPTRTFRGHTEAVRAIIALDDARFVSSGEDGTVRVWYLADADAGPLATLPHQGSPVHALVVVTPDAFLSGGNDGVMRLWHSRTYALLGEATTPSAVHRLCVLSGGSIASGHWDGCVCISSMPGLRLQAVLRAHTDMPEGMVPLWDGRLATVSSASDVCITDLSTGGGHVLGGLPIAMKCCSLSPTGGLAVGCCDGRVVLVEFPWHRRRDAVVSWLMVRWH